MTEKSPCIDKCDLNDESNICNRCYRSIEEITLWLIYSNEEKRNIKIKIKERKQGQKENEFNTTK